MFDSNLTVSCSYILLLVPLQIAAINIIVILITPLWQVDADDRRFKADTGQSRLIQTRERMFKVQQALVASTTTHRRDVPEPPNCSLLSTQFRSVIDEMGFKTIKITGEADYFMALQVRESLITTIMNSQNHFFFPIISTMGWLFISGDGGDILCLTSRWGS